jgi:hypothetical protein
MINQQSEQYEKEIKNFKLDKHEEKPNQLSKIII